MDRNIVYPGAIPLDTDILSIQRNVMVAFGAMAAAMLGSSVVIDGLGCVTASGLTVQIAPGSIFQLAALEATPYGSLPADTADSIIKVGINTLPITTVPLTAPSGVGQAINYLIEAQILEQDASPVVLPFYNASNPAQPYLGPNNSGVASNTVRQQRVSLQVKAGPAATTGSQVTPGVDAGWVPLWIVTVNNGAVSLSGANVVQHPSAPFVPTKLPMQRRRLTAPLNLYVSATGNDSNSGLAVWNPFATKQAAVSYIYNALDCNGQNVTVNIAAGSYTDGVVIAGLPVGSGSPIAFVGAGSGSTSIAPASASAFICINGGTCSIASMTVAGGGTGNSQGAGVYAISGGNIIIGSGVAFGACAYAHIAANGGSVGTAAGAGYIVSGNAPTHWSATNPGSVISVQGVTVTIAAGLSFTQFASATLGGMVACPGDTFAGSTPTGSRFTAASGGIITTNGAGTSYLPGSTAGNGSTPGAAPYGLYQ